VAMLYGRTKNYLAKGFSLLELVVVVAVLSILAAMALPAYNSIRVWLDETEAKALGNGVLKSIAHYTIENGSFPSSWVDVAKTFRDLRYCEYDKAVQRSCGTGVGELVSSIDSDVNPLNCIVVTQASYELCGRKSANQFLFVIKEFQGIRPPSSRKSVSGCFSLDGAKLVQQITREPVWIDC